MGCKGRSGSAWSTVTYERDTAVPAASSTSMMDVRGHVLGAGRAVVVDAHHGPKELLDGVPTAHDGVAFTAEDGIGEQLAQTREIAGVHELGVLGDEVLDGPGALRPGRRRSRP